MSCFPPLHSRLAVEPVILEDERKEDLSSCVSVSSAYDLVKTQPSDKTPTRPPQDRTRSVLGELTVSSSRLNSRHPTTDGNTEGAAVAANRLIDFTRGTPPRSRHGLILKPQHKRRFSKARNLSVDDASGTDSTISDVHSDLGGRARPIMHFRPNLWRHLDRDRSILNIDLFWPLKPEATAEDDDSDVFPLEDLQLLCEFRNLRSLQLNGMLQSYQKDIWQTCWLNPGLEELTLEMALEPVMNESYSPSCPVIQSGWTMKSGEDGSVHYLGQHGEGILNPEFGIGEYLDKQAIALAKLEAAPRGGRLRYLPIVNLALSGFVVDAGAMKWFDPLRLRQIELRHNCVDAGFALPANMVDLVKMSCPGADYCRTVKLTKVAREDIRPITLKKGKKINESAGLKPKIGSILNHRWFSTNKRSIVGKGDSAENKMPARLSSSDSMSSLGQRSSSVASRKSQDSVVL